ncbi:hypothetical protein LT85_0324 [Collimonas arenae]|uniref:Uncharacterized protein n=1 Tax=Collimonas arenae TaxID=279058 RepID=A0A0A1F720_9BURK|nr:hypothetical protein [Collimonas arenae]AIY39484.1 hypothetical protein LT85_0324 [Collimonas arenae]
MSLIDASQQLLLRDLRNQRRPKILGVQDWILSASYRVEQSPKKKNVTLLLDASTDIVEALAHDIVRYSSAAIESAQRVEALIDRPLASGWIIIRSYYSAYFAANSLMRLFGYFCTNIDQRHVAAIHQIAHLYEIPLPTNEKSKLASGTYSGRYITNSHNGAVVLKSLHSIGGGAHKQFWFAFKEFLDSFQHDLSQCVLSKSQMEKARSSVKFLLSTLCQENHPNGNWLSEIRNSVNYRLEHGAWHPYDGNQTEARELIELISCSFLGEPRFQVTDAKANELSRSTDSCSYLLAWMLCSVNKISEQSNGGAKHFLKAGPLALLR